MADLSLPQVLFVGSIHLDRMIQLAKLPTPGETVIATGNWSQLGGKAANQAMAAGRYPQVQSALMACVGDDEAGRQAQGTLTSQGVRTFLQVTPQLPTGSSVALLEASGENVGVVLPGANTALNGASLAALLSEQHTEVMVCQWETPLETLRTLLSQARAAGVITLMNAAPWQDTFRDLLLLADHVIVNAVEAQGWTGTDPQARLEHLSFGHPSVVVTLGSGGVLHYQDSKLALDLSAPKVHARSTHGAGDHFVGVLAASLAQGTAMPLSLRQAVASAAEFVQLLHKDAITPVP